MVDIYGRKLIYIVLRVVTFMSMKTEWYEKSFEDEVDALEYIDHLNSSDFTSGNYIVKQDALN